MLIWNVDVIETLRQLRAQGFSYSAAARKINASFGTCFTREAVIGKARRLGLASPSKAPPKPGRPHIRQGLPAAGLRRADQSEQSSYAPSVALRCKPVRIELARPMPVQAEPVLDLTPLRCAAVTPLRIAFSDLETEHCRYPYGDGPYRFCGHVRRPGSSYCPAHADLVADPDAMTPVEYAVDRDTAAERHHRTDRFEIRAVRTAPDLDFYLKTEKNVSTNYQGERYATRQTQKA